MNIPDTAAIINNRSKGINIMKVIHSMITGIDCIDMNEAQKSKAKVLIDAFLSGNLSDELQERVGNWFIQQGEDEEGSKALQDVFDQYADKYSRPDIRTARAWQKRCKQLGLTDRKGRRLLLHKRMMRVAAVVLPLLLVGGSGILFFDRVKEATEQTQPTFASVRATDSTHQKVALPCGTEVILKAGSEITYNKTDYPAVRNVQLTGEAYFSVTKHERQPFTVNAEAVTVTVLGTEFNVNTSGEDNQTEVSLFTGSVSVSAGQQTVTLEPMQQFVRDNISGKTSIREFDADKVTGWRTALSMNNIRLDEAFGIIGDHFGVTVVTDDLTPRSKVVRARFRNNTLTEVLDGLMHADRDFDYEIKGDTVYVSGR